MKRDDGQHDCFWYRALVPKLWTQPDPANRQKVCLAFREQPWGDFLTCVGGSDGAGDARDKRVANVAASRVVVLEKTEGPQLASGIVTTIDGRQTIPRNEVTGASHSVARCIDSMHEHSDQHISATPSASIPIVTDASYVTSNWTKSGLRQGTNQDTWIRLTLSFGGG